MDVTASLIKLKPNSLARVEEWAETINRRQAEALATLKDEGVELESWFYVQVEGSDYLLCFMRSESMTKATEAAGRSEHEIDAYHHQFKADTWVRGGVVTGKLLVDLNLRG